MLLATPGQPALTTSTNHAHDSLEIEYDSDETVDHFQSPWWQQFGAAVGRDDDVYASQIERALQGFPPYPPIVPRAASDYFGAAIPNYADNGAKAVIREARCGAGPEC